MPDPGPELMTARWLSGRLRQHLENAISEHRGQAWRARTVRDLSDLACHPSAILSDGSFDVFVKYSTARDAERQFGIEQASLDFLSNRAGVLVPLPIEVVPVPGGTLFVAEALEPIDRGPVEWREIGRTLARIHEVQGDRFGFHIDTYFGPIPQDNTPTDDWTSFYRERRLQSLLQLAIESGNIPATAAGQVEAVIDRFPDLVGEEPTPTLVHGDAQQNNFISTREGAYVIDPAIYYGNREVDLALLDYLQPVPDHVFEGYREVLPIPPGFSERRELWRIYGYLACVAVEGTDYLDRLAGSLRPVL